MKRENGLTDEARRKSFETRALKRAELKAVDLKIKWTWKFAVTKKCRECTNNQFVEVRDCQIISCANWPGRTGDVCSVQDLQKWEEAFLAFPVNQEIMKA